MKKNMGNLDKGIRILIAVIIAILAYTKVLDGTLAIVLLILVGSICIDKYCWILSALFAIRDSNEQEEVRTYGNRNFIRNHCPTYVCRVCLLVFS